MLRFALLALACLGCVRYEPRPLDPASHPAELGRRSLDDSALVAAVARYAGRPDVESGRWTDRQLAVAALSLRSDLPRLRAEWRAARAAALAAGARPGVGVTGEVEQRVGGRDDGSPWVVGLGALFTLELGGKRGARLQTARAEAALAETRLLAAAWDAVTGTRRAAAELAGAAAELRDAHQEIRLLEAVQELERARYAEAALGTSELARTSTEIQEARLALAGVEHRVLDARAALAAALAVPSRAVAALAPAMTASPECTSPDTLAGDSLIGAALTRRMEISSALGGYALAESRVRLEVARQFPDLELGPGFIWDQGVHRWTLALALPAVLGRRNRPAIRHAEVEREVAGLRVAEVQDSVLADVESAMLGCRGEALEVAAADSVVAAAKRLVERDRAAYERGESSRLEPARSELLLVRAERARRAAGRRGLLAAIRLDRALGGPLDGGWPDPRQHPEQEGIRP